MLEKTWRSVLNQSEFSQWVLNYASRRYTTKSTPFVDQQFESILNKIIVNKSKRWFKNILKYL